MLLLLRRSHPCCSRPINDQVVVPPNPLDPVKRMFSPCRLSATNNEYLVRSNVCSSHRELLTRPLHAIHLPVVLEGLNEDSFRSIDECLTELQIALVLRDKNDGLP